MNKLIELLGDLGVKIQKLGKGSYSFQADEINMDYLSSEEFAKQSQRLRGSILILGPLLARFGYGGVPKPGGDKIGRRRLDTHFDGFVKLGATFTYSHENHYYTVTAPQGLKGAYILLDEASVTGTANNPYGQPPWQRERLLSTTQLANLIYNRCAVCSNKWGHR